MQSNWPCGLRRMLLSQRILVALIVFDAHLSGHNFLLVGYLRSTYVLGEGEKLALPMAMAAGCWLIWPRRRPEIFARARFTAFQSRPGSC